MKMDALRSAFDLKRGNSLCYPR